MKTKNTQTNKKPSNSTLCWREIRCRGENVKGKVDEEVSAGFMRKFLLFKKKPGKLVSEFIIFLDNIKNFGH